MLYHTLTLHQVHAYAFHIDTLEHLLIQESRPLMTVFFQRLLLDPLASKCVAVTPYQIPRVRLTHAYAFQSDTLQHLLALESHPLMNGFFPMLLLHLPMTKCASSTRDYFCQQLLSLQILIVQVKQSF